MTRERLSLLLLLASIFLIRAIHPGQPIVENYVGRQIPTAMVARNLERGSGFLHPQLDTAPFPNLFLVEPPIYAQIVASFRPMFGLELEPTGRLVSAAAVVLGAWGLYGLTRRREGRVVAFLALASFGIFPVMIRYGRAFQPDALMVGCVLAGLRGWDEYAGSGNRRWAVFGGFILSLGIAVKITVAWALIPFFVILPGWTIPRRLVVAALMLIPAGSWYLYAWNEVAHPGQGSLANSESTSIWLKVLFSGEAWLRFATYDQLARGLCFRSFTPVGFVLAGCGLIAAGKLDRLWLGWALGCGLSILGLASKWHHAYYWIVVAPLAAVGVGRALAVLAQRVKLGCPCAVILGSIFLALCVERSISTFKTPEEWQSLEQATRKIKDLTGVEQLVVAPEAVLYYADVKGDRLEFDPVAVRRAVGEWSSKVSLPALDQPLGLINFYLENSHLTSIPRPYRFDGSTDTPYLKSYGRMIVADVGLTANEPRRRIWRQAIRSRPNTKILADQPGYLIAELR